MNGKAIIKGCAIALAIGLIVVCVLGILGIWGSVSLLRGVFETAEPVEAAYGPYGMGITELEMHIAAADIRIETGSSLTVWTDNPYITVEENQNKLVIREKSHVANLEDSELLVTIPQDTWFDEVELETGAGQIQVEALRCRDLDLDLGAGKAEFDLLEVSDRADIDGGAGEMEIHDGKLHNLEFDMGVGEARITAALTGDTDFSAGIGALYLTVLYAIREDYTICMNQGVGQLRVDGTTYTGDVRLGNGAKRLEINGGVGSIDITFRQPAA